MNIWSIITTAIAATILGYTNFSALKVKAIKKSYMYYIFASLFFIAPALGFGYIFQNQTPSYLNALFLAFIVGATMSVPSCVMQFYYRKQL